VPAAGAPSGIDDELHGDGGGKAFILSWNLLKSWPAAEGACH
jgi:hypothetical protein